MHTVKLILVLLLLGGFTIQVWEQVDKFFKGRTMLSVSNEKVESIPAPAISICSNPPYRKSAEKDWNIFEMNMGDVRLASLPYKNNETLMEGWKKSTYVYNDTVNFTNPFSRTQGDPGKPFAFVVNTMFFGSCFTYVSSFNFTVDSMLTATFHFPNEEAPTSLSVQIHNVVDRYYNDIN